MTSVLVIVPARDEREHIGACLDALLVALDGARRVGVLTRARIVVAAHRCTDATADVAAGLLARAGVDHLVLRVDDDLTVGELRSRAVAAGSTPGERSGWILSTDADSTVPPDWVERLLAVADATGADLVAGLTSLADWAADAAAQAAYRRLLADGMTADGHRHVYAANLAVRRTAYERAGGFPARLHGEEQGLADAIRAQGGTVVGALEPVVITSARMPGRAEGGLGALLAELTELAELSRAQGRA